MDTTRAGTRIEAQGEPQILFIGQKRRGLVLPSPVLRALGIGFALGMLAIAVLGLLTD